MKIPGPKALTLTPFIEEFQGYRFSFFKDDIWAALCVALMAIPQSIAYSLLAGLPPTAGLFSAIFGTIFAAGFGSSRHLVCGPSTGTAILIQTSISDVLSTYYETAIGAEKEAITLHILTQIVILMGLLQILAALINVGKLLQFVSRPVTLGYFAGITLAIISTQLFYFFGIPSKGAFDFVLLKLGVFFTLLKEISVPDTIIGVFSLALLFLLRKRERNIPDALIMLVSATGLAYILSGLFQNHPIAFLESFGVASEPIPSLTFPLIDFSLLNKIFPAAVAISFLAILEVFSISRSFGTRSGHRVQVNQDVLGLSIGNVFLSFLSGALPTSGSASRTSLSYQLHSHSRVAAILSGVFTGIFLLFFWPWVEHVPLAALAAMLLATVPSLLNWREIKLCFKATKEDAYVFTITFICCLIFSLDIAFFIGIVISIVTYLKKSATPHLVEYAFNAKGRLTVVSPRENLQRKVRIIGIAGELYFASAEVFQTALQSIAEDQKTSAIVLRLNNIYHVDASMCLAVLQLFETLKASGRYLIISGLTEEVWQVFHRAGLVKKIGLDNLYFTDETNPQFSTWKACLRAQELVHSH